MTESLGISVTNACYECQVIAMSVEAGYPEGKCFECQELAEAKQDTNAWNLHEEDRLGEGKGLSLDVQEPASSEWVSSETIVGKAKPKVVWIERYDDDCHLIEMAVKFIDPEEEWQTRSEFTPPIVHLEDGGVLDTASTLEWYMLTNRDIECQWCHLMTPKAFNDCQSCDHPLELNLR